MGPVPPRSSTIGVLLTAGRNYAAVSNRGEMEGLYGAATNDYLASPSGMPLG
jgi:hypothetical protein